MWGAQGWNQWALQPAMFNDVPHEQIDWAALAKQWIQMQQAQPPPDPTVSPLLPPVPAPAPSTSAMPIIPPPPPGHSPVIPDEFSSEASAVSASLLKTSIASSGIPEPFQNDRPFEAEPAGFIQKPANNTYWNKSQWEASAAGDIDERLWSTPSIEPSSTLPSTLIAGKETYDYGHMHDNPPLAMQSIDYNHMSEFTYNQIYPTESQYDQYWSQVNAAPPISPMFLKKEHSSASTATTTSIPVEEDTSQIDAAKRKQLPAWIREGLEKMEQERIKKLEKEKSEKEKAEKLAQAKLKKDVDLKDDTIIPGPVKSKFDSDSDTEEADLKTTKPSTVSKRSPSPVRDLRTEEEKRQEYMLNIRRILTEVLLTVTNAEMYAIAEEVIKKEQLKARQLASSASLTSVASGLRSLANYGSASEASDADDDKEESDSDEELYRRIKEKKKLFAIKEKKIIAELEKKELEEQNEALKSKNEISSVETEQSEQESSIKEPENPIISEEAKPVGFIPPSDVLDQAYTIPFIEEKNDNPFESSNKSDSKELKSPVKDIQSSNSSSNSSESESESSEKQKNKSSKNDHGRSKDSNRSKSKIDKSPRKHHKHRSSDSDSSDKLRKSSRSYDKTSKKSSSYKKKKKSRRSDSSSSSSSSTRRRKYSSKSESSHNHSRDHRSRSYEDRDRRRRHSSSPKNYRSSRDSHRSRDSYTHRHEKDKYSKRDKYSHDYKRSPSPYGRSSKLPKKYRSSRSPSSESEYSSRKTKRNRTR